MSRKDGEAWRTLFGPTEAPIRAELFSVERLEQHAEALARDHRITSRSVRGHPLAHRLYDNTKVLTKTYLAFVKAIESRQSITPAAEWLLDNFHVVDEQIREIKDDLPPGYYRRLPKLADGPLAGYPRIFGISWALIAHSDSALDAEKLTRFIDAYQRVQLLTIGELWALAITLRVTLVENLRRLSEVILSRLAARQRADGIADRILGTDKAEPEAAGSVLRALDQEPWSIAFGVQLAQRLRDTDPASTPAVHWLNDKLSREGTTTDEIVREQVQRQSAMNVTVRNVITSMRLISMMNWAEFFESVSSVDAIMRAESNFAAMDFSTRDLYRRTIEKRALESGLDEADVARHAVSSAKQAASRNGDESPEGDPGYYLIGRGRRDFAESLGCKPSIGARLLRLHSTVGVLSYISLIAFMTLVVLALAWVSVGWTGLGGWPLLALLIISLVPASDLAVALVNRLIAQSVGATLLPGLALRDGVPRDMRTIIVVPTLLTSLSSCKSQIERLEVHYLSNPDSSFSFALLSDFSDSTSEHAADDKTLLDAATAGVAALNERHPRPDNQPRFFLLHRKRVWNESEGKWMGWERKRGKLHELNLLLRGAKDTTFIGAETAVATLPTDVRYVLTLDADTRLPIGAATRMVGKMAHPLNRPHFDPKVGLVIQGHAILQPRVTPSLPMRSEGSLYQNVFSGPNGLDPYALAISDIYQDLFEEGSYCGKGIYEIDTFEASLKGQIPENAVLSHDLLEGIFARAGLASDVEVVEEFPSRYGVASARQHRWVRGDWQLLPWIFGWGGKLFHAPGRTKIPLMGRWKLIDNLRRSLSAPAGLLALLVAWLQPLPTAEIWTAFIIVTLAAPPLLPVITGLWPRRGVSSLRNHFGSLYGDFELGLTQSAFLITFLAHQAWLMVDAVARTLYRLFVRRRNLLEWITAAQTDEDSDFSSKHVVGQIAISALSALAAAAVIVVAGHGAWPLAVPFLVVWMLSPLFAYWSSLPPPPAEHLSMTSPDAKALRLIARRTWRYFERFVADEDNHLPPDNFQEDPQPIIAHRTSPTNIGLYLLSVISARDFGWLGLQDAVERLEITVATMDRLDRFNGHFFNWYDTTDLRALEPKYVSSVDSGNLAGHLIALASACQEMATEPVIEPCWDVGLEDTLALMHLSLSQPAASSSLAQGKGLALKAAMETLTASLRDKPKTTIKIGQHLSDLSRDADRLVACAQAYAREQSDIGTTELLSWAEAFRATLAAHVRDLTVFMPWTTSIGEAVAEHETLAPLLARTPTLESIPELCASLSRLLAGHDPKPEYAALTRALEQSADTARAMLRRLKVLGDHVTEMAMAMQFGFMFDEDRQLISIGYRTEDHSLDGNFYDLLASEARLASFFAIAKGDVPAKHWFRLGRTLTPIKGGAGLISWSGSMFEYLMPSLVMRAPAGSLLERTNRLVVRRQEAYGERLGVPWGMSESEYNARDIEQTYQYSSFGVPDLGYKRGLGESTVIAPYASGLASMMDPGAAARNFERMAGIGASGAYGWYEAIDFTRSRVPDGKSFAVVKAYMAHHQAMTIVGIGNAVHDGRMRDRFHASPTIQAAELLLQERMPRDAAVARRPVQELTPKAPVISQIPETRRTYSSPHSRVPRTHLMSNGRYTAMVTATGSGYSRWRDIAITRWREDLTRDDWGAYIFLRDLNGGETWSAGYQPSVNEPDDYQATFAEDRAEIIRNDGALTTTLEIAISPEDDGEVRRVSITNHGNRTREIEVTSYAEVALARQADDVAHPAFAKLFVETEFAPELGAILATRRRRSAADPQVWAAHLAVVEGESSPDVQFETDRAKFIGRGRTVKAAAAMTDRWPLSNTTGAVLDTIFSLRRRVSIPRGATVRIAFWTLAAATRDDVLALADKHHDPMAFERATTLAWTQAQMQLHHLGIETEDAQLFQRLANHVIYADPTLRPPSDVLKRGMRKVSTLWGQSISGDLPIVLVRVREDDDLELVRQVMRAQEYWRLKRLAVDLVILNERASSYVQDLQTALDTLVRMNKSVARIGGDDVGGSAFVLRADLVPADVRELLQSVARVVLYGDRGSLAEQVNRTHDIRPPATPAYRRPTPVRVPPVRRPRPHPELEFFNGLGGFANDGRDYLTLLEGEDHTPAPWVNVIANPVFGFQVSNEGGGFTWALNSQQNQLTPWSNDPVGDAPGEVIYLRDDETGELWTATPAPIREPNTRYSARHGQGFTRFDHESRQIGLELLQFVPPDDPIKISRLRITNRSGRERRLSITAYIEWVLGANRTSSAAYVMTEIDPATGAMFAQNPWSDPFGGRVAFADLNGRQTAWTGDRTEFLGRNGALDRPAGLAEDAVLSGRVGPGLDPCAALQTHIHMGVDTAADIVFFLGQAASRAESQALVEKYRQADLDAVFADVTRQWDETLDVLQVKTPDRALDILVNRWLPYQTLACRMWARTGFYQASGAYGFRDQLQDSMALCIARPDVAREHLLKAAGRQFIEGDVQHWWLPESGRGVRTRVSDDRAWLAYVAAHYVRVTGDSGVLDEVIPFLEGPVLAPGERDSFFEPTVSAKTGTLFEHCALALDASLAMGVHGLPLMGTGDWNDGMDGVGEGGKGESVWLGWLLCAAINDFSGLAETHGATARAEGWRRAAADLKVALERDGWDGDWYRRAYFDDGAPLGSVSNNECRIDAISQSWAVISGAAEPERAERAMAAVERYLIRPEEQLSLLFTPPFDHPVQDPGYIKGYPPGVRENGGQYTHAAVWTVMAFAMQGDGDKAGELLSMLNPIRHADTPGGMQRYKVEPYVACADIYSVTPHVGRGGWTWYTGSAGWLYRAALEQILGFQLEGGHLRIDPCIPRAWREFEMVFRYRSSRYEISVDNPLGVCRGVLATKLDGAPLSADNGRIPLADDGATHRIQIVLGAGHG